MYIRFLLISCLVGLTSFFCNAQSQNVLKMDLVSVFQKGVLVSYERILNDSRSVELAVGYTSKRDLFSKIQVATITPQYKFYVSDWESAPNGFYFAPSLTYGYGRAEESLLSLWSTSVSVHLIGPGLNLGYQKLIKDKIALEASLGPVYYSALATASSDYSAIGISPQSIKLDGFSGFALQLNLNVGIGF
ncbi:DUF3575 domain-containing protein [Spirosoma sp. KUDC1026]|uniref:DUF3575 domain-containing protein n=1 Tax=Spirosoma sp. KUDC1026 TaxID=2745947 RepID=UPI00159BEA34|nr:DUF3575 domain-containing protein [Spirosoma sp. KUDC1026]